MLDSIADVVEWVRGTTLTRFYEACSPAELHEPFVETYRSAPARADRRARAVLLSVQADPDVGSALTDPFYEFS